MLTSDTMYTYSLEMPEFCDSARTEFCTEMANCAELTKRHRHCKILQILFVNIALSAALTAATASTKHFGVEIHVIKYLAVLCINAADTVVTISNCNKCSTYMHLSVIQ